MSPFVVLAPFVVVLIIVLFFARRRVNCPDCGGPMPLLYSPFEKTRRMWLAGGYLCPRCGCETNMAGEKVTAYSPSAAFPTVAVALLAVALLLGIGLVEVGALLAQPAAPPPVMAARMAEAAAIAQSAKVE